MPRGNEEDHVAGVNRALATITKLAAGLRRDLESLPEEQRALCEKASLALYCEARGVMLVATGAAVSQEPEVPFV